jgi:hypothetical protein
MKLKYLTLLLIPLFFISCDKEEDKTTTSEKTLPAIEQKLINFKEDLTSASKDEIIYTIEEAEWNLEGLLNYEEANNENNYHGLEFVHDVYQVSLTNGGISNTDLLEAYNYFLTKITGITQDETLFSDVVDLVIVEPESKDDAVDIEMVFSYGSSVAIYNYYQFEENEDWKLGFDWGPCGYNTSTENSSAEQQLEYKFNNPINVGISGFYTNNGYTEAYPNEFPEDYNNPDYDEILEEGRCWIIADYCTSNDCLSYEELNFYLNYFDYIKNEKVPSDKTYKSVSVETTLRLGGKKSGKDTYWCHYYRIFFGTFTPASSN